MIEKEVILSLQEENKLLRQLLTKRDDKILQLETRTLELIEQIHLLETKIHSLQIKKDSSNSSKPPSTDISPPKRNQSLREKSGRTSGGQFGHKGKTLQMIANPDEIVEINPNYCNKCGCDLKDSSPCIEAKRQVFDIPLVQFKVTEYRRNSKDCPRCGHKQESEFPKGITNHVQYGPNIESSVAYLSVYQYLPFNRLKECMNHLFKIDMSEGTIDNMLIRMSKKAKPVYDRIKESITQSKHGGSDESGVKVNGIKFWIWVWQTMLSTYITYSASRGMKTIDSEFPEGLENMILNTDRWAAQLKTKTAGHQLCSAHILRDANFVDKVDKLDWAKRLNEILKRGLELKKRQLEYSKNDPLVIELEHDLDVLLHENIPKELYKTSHVLQKSLLKHRDCIFTFLYHKDTPPDNNASERAIRNVKVKQKVSGQFKSGLEQFCILRSVIDTSIKRGVDVMFTLSSIANLNPAE